MQIKCKGYDLDGDGFISIESLLEFFPDDDQTIQLMESIDGDGDGWINLHECLIVMRTIGWREPGKKHATYILFVLYTTIYRLFI